MQAEKLAAVPGFRPLNIACVFSPPVQLAETPEAKKDIEQLSEDLEHEREDNKVEPEKKKEVLSRRSRGRHPQHRQATSILV
jgi:type I restriction enzyme R subunit